MTTQGKRILIVSPAPTHPTTSGNRARILSVCEALRREGHELHFAIAPEMPEDFEATKTFFEGRFRELEGKTFAPLRRTPGNLLRKLGRRLGIARSHVWKLDDWFDPNWSRQLAKWHEEERFEVVIVNYVFLSAAFDVFGPDVRKILETHDSFADRHLRLMSLGLVPEWYSTTASEERRGLARADVVVAIEARESLALGRDLPPDKEILTIAPFLSVENPVVRSSSPNAVFMASGNSLNKEGIRFFLDEAFALVRKAIPDFQLLLAGDICRHVDPGPGIVLLGRVDDPRDAYSRAALAINPVRGGTGFCIKSLEAIAFGMPLVATKAGGRGLQDIDSNAWIETGDRDGADMAAAIVALLSDGPRLERMASAAWRAGIEWNSRQVRLLSHAVRGAPAVANR